MYKNDTFHLQKKRDLMKKSGFPLQRLAKTPVRHSFTCSAALDTEWPALFCTHVSVYVVSLWQIWRQRCCPFKLSFSISKGYNIFPLHAMVIEGSYSWQYNTVSYRRGSVTLRSSVGHMLWTCSGLRQIWALFYALQNIFNSKWIIDILEMNVSEGHSLSWGLLVCVCVCLVKLGYECTTQLHKTTHSHTKCTYK